MEADMRRLATLALAIGLLGLCVVTARDAVGAALPVRADTGCSNLTLHGAFSYEVSGYYIDRSNSTPVVTAYYVEGGLITFSGSGTLTAISEGSFNGIQFGREERSGVYSVNPNCTGSFTVTTVAQPCCPAFDIHYDVVIVRGGNELTIFQRDGGVVTAGNGIRLQSVSN
jgi:hypothetical protein